jgi:hypothetical protein
MVWYNLCGWGFGYQLKKKYKMKKVKDKEPPQAAKKKGVLI